ncbi:MAG TPA: TIGR03557 family F420-dependent LLM class oxidoreductase [Candidatus Dormibacteraeota bacterium]|nr:TIGR03557 family F420-dependent LLM class oxidoreductase [Candidatus Dormibacteraeota bacterium]
MTTFGYTLMCEQTGPKELVRYAELAEKAAFDFAVISDHFHPWLEEQGESPFAWSVLGAVADRTTRMQLMTMVTCPIIRYHPAVVAQMAATIALMSDGRFMLGLGAGENLNVHVVGKGWPPAHIRHQMLEEAIEVIQELWKGDYVFYQGEFYSVHDAKIFSRPAEAPLILVAASGRESCDLAATSADGLIATEPKAALVSDYRESGGQGPTYAQIALSWGRDERQAVKTAHRYFRFTLPAWKVMSELPNPVNFNAASKTVREEDVAQAIPCGPDPEKHLQAIKKYVDAGFEHIAVLQAGDEQEGFIKFWTDELRPRLEKAGMADRLQEAAAPAAGRSSR